MGITSSQLESEIAEDETLSGERYFGLVNFGNTCYCNSVLQALFFCEPFREKILQYRPHKTQKKETLLTALADLFHTITSQKRSVGKVAPKKFISRLRKDNGAFDNFLQQDAHEFLIYMLNKIADILQDEGQQQERNGPTASNKSLGSRNESLDTKKEQQNWIHEIFRGCLTNETRCLTCENVRTKDEDFLDLSVDVAQNSSIVYCLKCFSDTETMQSENKYYCEFCRCKQEAQKCLRVKKPPLILALHLKRFKYSEEVNGFTKLSCRVVFPMELRLPNTSDGVSDHCWLYKLFAVIVHSGSGPNRGHYVTLIKSHGLWLLFDDDVVEKICPVNLEDFFGQPTTWAVKSSYTAYILFYQACPSLMYALPVAATSESLDRTETPSVQPDDSMVIPPNPTSFETQQQSSVPVSSRTPNQFTGMVGMDAFPS